MTVALASAIVNVEGERSAAAAQIHKTRPRKAPDYNTEEDKPAREHLPGIVGLTVDHAGLASVKKSAFIFISSSSEPASGPLLSLSEGREGEQPR